MYVEISHLLSKDCNEFNHAQCYIDEQRHIITCSDNGLPPLCAQCPVKPQSLLS